METKTVQIRTRIGFATAKNDKIDGWPKGEQKSCHVAKMSNGRFAIYKGVRHFREPSGYKVYDSIDAIESDFHTELIQESVN